MTFYQNAEQALELWLAAVQAKGATRATLRTYRDRVGYFLRWLKQEHGIHHLDEIQPPHIILYIQHCQARETWGSETVQDYCRDARTFLNWCHRMELIDKNPFAKIPLPKGEQTLLQPLSDDDVRRLFQACEGKEWLRRRDKALLHVLLSTGLRASECHQMTVRDGTSRTFTVRGKGGKHRLVIITPECEIDIQRYLRVNPYRPGPDDPLWWGHCGALTLEGLKQTVQRIAMRAGMGHLGPHRLRRTFATNLLRQGAPMEVARELMGHSSYRMLQQYVRLSTDDLLQAIERYDPLKNIKETRR